MNWLNVAAHVVAACVVAACLIDRRKARREKVKMLEMWQASINTTLSLWRQCDDRYLAIIKKLTQELERRDGGREAMAAVDDGVFEVPPSRGRAS